MKTFLELLFEANASQIRQYYNDIPERDYYAILKADPTAIIKGNDIPKVGKYSKKALDCYRKKSFNIEDLSKKLA